MNDNIKKFNSHADYEKWKAKDGWAYPNVSYVDSSTEQAVYYNNEFIMRWSNSDTVITPTFLGDISHAEFKAWVDNASRPCEIKKDGTDFAYLKTTDLTKRADNTDSHYGVDYPDYLQFSEIENINVGLFQNTKENWCEVRFNFDLGCPKGFHKWFAHPYWNSTLKKYTKLVGRYNIIPTDTVSTVATNGITINAGMNMGPATSDVYEKGNWNANAMFSGINNTLTQEAKDSGFKLLEITYWEHLVLSYIFSAYFKTFDTQSIAKGLQTDSSSNYRGNYPNGAIDTAESYVLGSASSHYAVANTPNTSNQIYKFLWLDMPLHGQQWIWGAGFVPNSSVTPGQYWMTFDDLVANKAATMNKNDADITGQYPVNQSGAYINYIDLYGVPQKSTGGSSSTGMYDGFWSTSPYDSRIAYLGGGSFNDLVCGAFARNFIDDAGATHWSRRGRATMVR